MSQIKTDALTPTLTFRGRASALLNDLFSFLSLHAELFFIEAKEAGSLLGKNVALLIGAAFCGLVFYSLLLIVLAQLMGHLLAVWGSSPLSNWFGGAAILAVLHLFAGIFLVMICRKSKTKRTSLFEYTTSEWKKDIQWLKNENERQK